MSADPCLAKKPDDIIAFLGTHGTDNVVSFKTCHHSMSEMLDWAVHQVEKSLTWSGDVEALYHAYILLQFADGNMWKLHKVTSGVEVGKRALTDAEAIAYATKHGHVCTALITGVSAGQTLEHIYEGAETWGSAGSDCIYDYDAATNNCQRFVRDIVTAIHFDVDTHKADVLTNLLNQESVTKGGVVDVISKVTSFFKKWHKGTKAHDEYLNVYKNDVDFSVGHVFDQNSYYGSHQPQLDYNSAQTVDYNENMILLAGFSVFGLALLLCGVFILCSGLICYLFGKNEKIFFHKIAGHHEDNEMNQV